MLLAIAFLMFGVLIAAWLVAPDIREAAMPSDISSSGAADLSTTPVHA